MSTTRFFRNMLLKFANDERSHIERILWIDNLGSQMVLIDILDGKALPVIRNTVDISYGIIGKTITIVDKDPLVCLLNEEEIPDKWKKRRDEAMKLITPLVANDNTDIFDPKKK